MAHKETASEHVLDEQGRKVMKAIIVREDVMFGNIRIKCPISHTEHEVPFGTERFVCPIENVVLLIGGA